MSSELNGVSLVTSAVVTAAVPVAVALGAGWLAWQAGKLVVGAAQEAIEEAAEKKRQAMEEEHQRKESALAVHRQIVLACQTIQSELRSMNIASADAAALQTELSRVCGQTLPEDSGGIEQINLNAEQSLKLILHRQKRLNKIRIADSDTNQSQELDSLIHDLHLSCESVNLLHHRGKNVTAVSPQVQERAELTQQLNQVAAQVYCAIEFINDLSKTYGLNTSNNVWFQSLFGSAEEDIQQLHQPTSSNQELREGIRTLEEAMASFNMVLPDLQKERSKIDLLYPVYLSAATALGEPRRQLRQFRGSEALEQELHRLQKRQARAEECQALYRQLGPAAYICHAWNEELKAAGYSIFSPDAVCQLSDAQPECQKNGKSEAPFYQWEEDLTQFYEISPDCSLQLLVQPDGTTTMRTIADMANQEKVCAVQKKHCSKMQRVYDRLRENWFISSGMEQTHTADEICTLEQWREDCVWREENVYMRERTDQSYRSLSIK